MIKKGYVGLLALLAACSSVTESGAGGVPDVRLGLTGELFVRDAGSGVATVPLVFENRGDETVRVPRCGSVVGVEVLRAQGSSWEQFGSGLCRTNEIMAPHPVAPGATLKGTWQVREAGRYRLRVVAGCDCEIRIGYPAESKPFDVQ